MRLRSISIFFTVGIALISSLVSCNDSETETIATTLSADAQIYSFSATSIPRTHEDTINFPFLKNVKFAIDQSSKIIYNVDSLPYGFTVRKIAVSMSFSSSTPNATQVVYPNDSIVDWESASDSIDFMIYPAKDASLKGVPQVKFKVTAQNGNAPDNYTIKLLIHKVDPDSITWRQRQNLPVAGPSKVLLVGDQFYTFIDNSGTLQLFTSSNSAINWSSKTVSGLSSQALKSISYYRGKFYATDAASIYRSDNGESWSTLASYTGNVIGGLPNVEVGKDSVFVCVRKDGNDLYLDYSNDAADPTANSNKIADADKVNFPIEGYSVVSDQKNRILLVTGGKKMGGTWSNSTWMIEYREGSVRMQEVSKLIPFKGAEGLVSFLYNGKLFAWAQDTSTSFKLYMSDLGMNWVEAPNKQLFAPTADKVKGQSIVVDGDNYIWTFGGKLDSYYSNQVWQGRMNKLNK